MSVTAGPIVTLTANPSFDRTVALPVPLERGAVHRVDAMTSQAGGKGVNISRAAVSAGLATVAVLPALADDPFVRDLEQAGIECRPSRPAGAIRVNLTLTEPDGTTTKLNTPGAAVSAEHLDDLAETLVRHARGSSWAVLAGSLPPGAPTDFYAALVPRLHEVTRVAVDTSDAPLAALVDRLPGAAPDLLKPNAEELASVTGTDAATLEADPAATAKAARVLVERGVGTVLATLGGRGAVLVSGDGAWFASPPPTTVVSTVGAGDCTLFGYLLAELRGLTAPDRLALAVAYGSAAAGLPGTTIPGPDDLHPERVQVQQLDPS
ncbi:1-phosphofructokinase family hexose kinase [Nocardioides sp.]|uniref:1-phosphofructokinase family hexose kinase n=1 Tax=Nocardioides sp. TaxID=35761 RepID=UPI001A2EDFBA|nr:1-phosphofructokinase family hexose kinase [Nocardioides sp.]MBJ7359883.1 1-phosphofructokinase family hexose kinase [Nocardioides sp.]